MSEVVVAIRKYRPSNGPEGEIFYEQWCGRCVREPDYEKAIDCDIFARSFCHGIDEPEYPVEWIEDKNGSRRTAFKPKP